MVRNVRMVNYAVLLEGWFACAENGGIIKLSSCHLNELCKIQFKNDCPRWLEQRLQVLLAHWSLLIFLSLGNKHGERITGSSRFSCRLRSAVNYFFKSESELNLLKVWGSFVIKSQTLSFYFTKLSILYFLGGCHRKQTLHLVLPML